VSFATTKEKDSDFLSVIKQLSLLHGVTPAWGAAWDAVPIMLLQFFLQQIFAFAEDRDDERGITKEKTRIAKRTFRNVERIFINSGYYP
jgi:hypothetical protein